MTDSKRVAVVTGGGSGIGAANWDSMLAVNPTGAYHLVQAVLPDMRAGRQVSSVSGNAR